MASNSDQNDIPESESLPQSEPLSKRALRKLRRKEKFDKAKVYRRKQEREKRKQRYAEAREQGVVLGPSRKSLKRNLMKNSSRKETIVIDCDFDELMAERDILKLVNQIQRCYSINRRFTDPVQFHCTSVKGKTLQRLQSVGDYKGWDIHIHDQSYTDVFTKDHMVYLSSESDDVLMEMKPEEVYIIGGLVDHNHHKGLCHRLAVERGIRHARLPIDEFMKMRTRKVLTVDQVFNILTQFLELGKWEEAFYSVIPKRKGAVLLGDEEEDSDEKVKNNEVAADNNPENVIETDGITNDETLTETQTENEDVSENPGNNQDVIQGINHDHN